MANLFSGVAGNALNILGAARQYYKGIGLSQRAHQLTSDYLNQSKSSLNSILSLGIAQNSSTEFLTQKIKAIRAGLPHSQRVAAEERAAENADNGAAAANPNGTNVDTQA
jgi:hypothetical protein